MFANNVLRLHFVDIEITTDIILRIGGHFLSIQRSEHGQPCLPHFGEICGNEQSLL